MARSWRHGDKITPERLNEMERALAPRVGPGLGSRANGKQVSIYRTGGQPGGAGAFELRRMKVVTVHDEYLECILVDGDKTEYAAATENVAKPAALRTAGDSTYAAADVILAGRPIWGGTGVSVDAVPLCWEVLSPTGGAKWKSDP